MLTYRDPGCEAYVVDEGEDVRGAEVGQAQHRHHHHPGGWRHLGHLREYKGVFVFTSNAESFSQ